MYPDLDAIEDRAHEELSTWGRQLAQFCLDLCRELRFWRQTVGEHVTIVEYCPGCEYEVEVDPLELFRKSDMPKPHCLTCGSVLTIRAKPTRGDL